MIKIPNVQGKKFGVYGLGATGIASADALVASGAEVYSWDENPLACQKIASTEYRAEHPTQWPWDQLSSVVLSPGVPLTHPKPHPIVQKAKSAGVEVIGDIELFARVIEAMDPEKRPQIVTVTGSNGKSTTTSLITHILRETGHYVFEGGNIGQAVLSLEQPRENSIYVLELSSYQLDLVQSLHANVSVLLNISPDHLDRHGGMDGYIAAKRRIFRNLQREDYAIIGVDDAVTQTICTDLIAAQTCDVIPVSALGTLGHGVFVLGGELFYNFENKTSQAGRIPEVSSLVGKHNHQNAAISFSVCNRLGVSPPLIMLSMAKFRGLAHRMEKITEISGVQFINDSKATNTDAAAQALASYKDIFWLAGGRAKEGGIEELLNQLGNVRKAFLFGEAGADFSAQIGDRAAKSVHMTMEDAIRQAFHEALLQKGTKPVILLSPSAASFDEFANFEVRGDAFRAIVQQIAAQGGEAA